LILYNQSFWLLNSGFWLPYFPSVQILLTAHVVDIAIDQDKDRSAAAAIIVIPPGPIYDPRLFAKRANAPFQEADDLVDLQRQQRSRR